DRPGRSGRVEGEGLHAAPRRTYRAVGTDRRSTAVQRGCDHRHLLRALDALAARRNVARDRIPLREPLEGRPSTDSLGSLGVVSVVSLWTKNLLRQASELCQLGCVKRIGEVAAHGVSEGGLRGGEDLGPLFGHRCIHGAPVGRVALTGKQPALFYLVDDLA